MTIDPSVLVVDDTPELAGLLDAHLSSFGFNIQVANSGAQALAVLNGGFRGPVLLDLNLPDYQNLELFHEILRKIANIDFYLVFF